VQTGRTSVVGDDELRRMARSVEAAAAHLEDFATMVRFALGGLGPGN